MWHSGVCDGIKIYLNISHGFSYIDQFQRNGYTVSGITCYKRRIPLGLVLPSRIHASFYETANEFHIYIFII